MAHFWAACPSASLGARPASPSLGGLAAWSGRGGVTRLDPMQLLTLAQPILPMEHTLTPMQATALQGTMTHMQVSIGELV